MRPNANPVKSAIAGLDGLYPRENAAEEVSAVDQVLFDRKSAEVILAHVLAQDDQPVIDSMLFGNGASPAEAC